MKNNNFISSIFFKTVSTISCNFNATNPRYQKRNMFSLPKGGEGGGRYEIKDVCRASSQRAL